MFIFCCQELSHFGGEPEVGKDKAISGSFVAASKALIETKGKNQVDEVLSIPLVANS